MPETNGTRAPSRTGIKRRSTVGNVPLDDETVCSASEATERQTVLDRHLIRNHLGRGSMVFAHRVVVLVVLVAMCLGAAFGALLLPLPADRFEAEAVVAVQPDSAPESQSNYWHAFAGAIKLRPVATAAAEVSPSGVVASDIPDRVRALGHPRSGLVRVRARGATVEQAIALANSVAVEGVSFMRHMARLDLERTYVEASFAFEDGPGQWAAQTDFSRRTRTLRVLSGRAYAGTGRLFFSCEAGTAGCGPGVRLSRVFRAGVTYRARLFARSSNGNGRLSLVLGVPGGDVEVGRPVFLSSTKYRRLSVQWTPVRTSSEATLAVRTTGAAALDASIDNVTVTDFVDPKFGDSAARKARDLVAAQRVRRATAVDRFVVVERAVSVGERRGSAATRTALGAGGAAIVAWVGLAFGAAAARRRGHQGEPGEDPPVKAVSGDAARSGRLPSELSYAAVPVPALRALHPRIGGYAAFVEPYVRWMVLLACVAFFLQSAGTVEVVYTIRPSFALLAGATIIGAPLVWAGWSMVPKWILWPAVALALVYTLSTFGSAGSSLGGGRAGPQRELAYLADLGVGLASFGLIVALWDRGRFKRDLLHALVFAGALAGAYGSYQWVAQELNWPLRHVLSVIDSDGLTRGRSQGIGVFGLERARGTFLEPHFLGAFLAGSIPLTAALWPSARTPRYRWALIGAAVIMVAALMFTSSVPAWATLLVCSTSVLAVWFMRNRGRLAVAGATAVLVTLLVAVPVTITNPGLLSPVTGRTVQQLELTTAFRTTAWQNATTIWSRRPILGYGPGQSSVQLTREVTGSLKAPSLLSAQGVWAAALIDAGALGLACWVLLVGGIVCYGFLSFVRDPTYVRGAVMVAALVAVASGLIAGDRLELRTWVALGLLLAVSRPVDSRTRTSQVPVS
jgi:hypothetical protein